MNIAIKVPTSRVVRGVQRYESARREVSRFVGDTADTCDTADSVYEHALRKLGHDVRGLVGHPGAAQAMFRTLSSKRAKPRIATDSKTVSTRNEMFPNANRLLSGF